MVESRYVRASEVAEILDVSKAKAYKLIAEMNDELRSQNIIVINGRVPRKYLMKRIGEWKSQLVIAVTNWQREIH